MQISTLKLLSAAAAVVILTAAGGARADVDVIQDSGFSCGQCVMNFTAELNPNQVTAENNLGVHVLYTATNTIEQGGGGQATLVPSVDGGTIGDLTIQADQNYAAETFLLGQTGDSTVVDIVVTTTTGTEHNVFTLTKNETRFELVTSLGQLIQTVFIDYLSGAGLTSFRQDRIATELAQVPLPPALVLFGSGLLGMVALGRRRLRGTHAAA
jgi:hypothetical protein